MRLTGLQLAHYGIFEAGRIDLDPAPGRINLLVAANGAGKSIIRQAFSDLLFGIHGQTAMGFRFGYPGMQVRAEGIAADGVAFALARRKGQGRTLTGADGVALEDATVARLLGHTDRAILERLFALDTRRLRVGGEELLASEGALAEALVAAAGGLRQVREIRRSLEEERDSLAPTRKAEKRPFYEALDRFAAAGRRLRDSIVRPDTRERQEKEFSHLEAERQRRNEAAGEASRKIARLERIRRVVGPLATHRAATEWLLANADAPVLPPDTRQRLRDARTELWNAGKLLERETGQQRELSERIDGIAIDAAMLEQAAAIEHLAGRAPVARQAAGDVPKREAELAGAVLRMTGLLQRLGLTLPVERAGEVIPPAATVLRARQLFNQYGPLQAELARLPGEIAESEREITEGEGAIRSLARPGDTPDNIGELQRLLREIRAPGEPVQRLEEAGGTVAEKEARLQAALARVPGWRGDAEALIRLRPQAADTYQRLAKGRSGAERALETATETVARIGRSKAEDEARLEQLAAGSPIADQAAIAGARERRDAGWHLIFRRAFTSEPPALDEEQAWAEGMPLPLAYERSVRAADALADRCNQDAKRLAQAAELRLHIAQREKELGEAEAARRQAEAALAEHSGAWQQACAPLGFASPPELADVTGLLAGRDGVIDAASLLQTARAFRSELEGRHAGWARALAGALGCAELDGPAREPMEIADLLQRADVQVAAAAKRATERTRLEATLAASRKTLKAQQVTHQRALGRLEKFSAEWAVTRSDLTRPEAEAPATTIGILELFNGLDTEKRTADDLGIRLKQMREEVASFRAEAALVGARVLPELGSADAFEASAGLSRRLGEERGKEQRRGTLSRQLEDATAAVARETEACARAEEALQSLLAVIGAGTVDAAEERVLAAEERAKQQGLMERAADELRQRGDGHDLEELRAEAAAVAIDDVVARIKEFEDERERNNAEAQEIAGRIAGMRAEMEREIRESGAQDAAAAQQAAVATIDHVLDEAALMHLASLLLRSSLEQVAATGTPALLSRIGQLLSILTGGVYLRVEAEDQGFGSARLVAIETQFPNERKTVEELSEGTRDQLFLALRLAAIEDHVATQPPLPFLGDDILQSFDDDRALAAMRALVELSRRVQVIVLSHHRHMLSLAERLPKDQVHISRMAPATA